MVNSSVGYKKGRGGILPSIQFLLGDQKFESLYSMIKFFINMLILLSLLKSKNILYILLNQVLMFFRRKKLDNRVIQCNLLGSF
jgi:hypothetical protein